MELAKVRAYQGAKVNDRRESGFYWRYKEEGGRDPMPVPANKRLTGEGFTIAWGLGKNLLDPDLPVTMRQIEAAIYMPVETKPVAHLSFDLFRARRGRYVDNEEFVYCCDTFSQDVYGVAYGITEGHLDVADYFSVGPILYFRGMEVRPPFHGHGHGVRFAKTFIASLVAEFGATVTFLKPLPLQFEGAGRARDEAGRTLEQARKKLADYYVRTLGCRPVRPRSHYYFLEA